MHPHTQATPTHMQNTIDEQEKLPTPTTKIDLHVRAHMHRSCESAPMKTLTHLVDRLHVAGHARQRLLAGAGLPQEKCVVVAPRDQPLRPPAARRVVPPLRRLRGWGEWSCQKECVFVAPRAQPLRPPPARCIVPPLRRLQAKANDNWVSGSAPGDPATLHHSPLPPPVGRVWHRRCAAPGGSKPPPSTTRLTCFSQPPLHS